MNLLEAKRLVRKIVELLREERDAALAPKLADDFASACRASILRLNQCEAMIASGDRLQALQLAETTPNLLDLIAVLEFREAIKWRNYCREHQFTVAESFDDRAVSSLNRCYTQGIASDHPLYRDYRRAMVLKDDEAALSVLRTIVRLNPSDQNAGSELARLDAKVLGRHLATLASTNAPVEIAQAVDQIEALAFVTSPAGEIWNRAQVIRCGVLLDSVQQQKEKEDWRAAIDTLDRISTLQRDWGFALCGEDQSRFQTLHTWADGERDKDAKDREFKGLLVKLRHLIEVSEEKEIAAREIRLPELKADLEELQKTWRAIEQFARSVPDELASRSRKRIGLLKAEVSRQTRARTRALTLAASAAVILIAAASWFFQQHLKTKDFVAQLNAAREKRSVRTAEKILSQLQANERRLLSKTSLQAAVAQAETFLKHEQGLSSNFDTAFKTLPTAFASSSGEQLRTISQNYSAATNLFAQLAPDLRGEYEPKLANFRDAWKRHLFDRSAEINKDFESAIQRAEATATKLDFGGSVETLRATVAELALAISKPGQDEQGFGGVVQLRNELVQRLAELRARHTKFDTELRRFSDGETGIVKARTLPDFNDGVAILAKSEFSTADLVRSAIVVRDLQPSDEALLRSLACGDNDALWTYFKSYPQSDFIPKAVMPAEKKRYLEMKNDDSISSEHYRYHLAVDRELSRYIQLITVGKLHTEENIWKKQIAFAPDVSSTMCVFREMEIGRFGKQYKLSTADVYDVKLIGNCSETAAYYTLKVPYLVALQSDTYEFPLLKVLDELRNSTEGSAVFRAYLFLRLFELMDLQPEAWGVPFAPSASGDRNALLKLVVGNIRSGDWYVSARTTQFTSPLNTFFQTPRPRSYWDEAQTISKVYRSVISMAPRYVGYAEPNGKPKLVTSDAAELWGWNRDSKAIGLLFRRVGTDWHTVNTPLPLSPLFTLPEQPEILLAKAGITAAKPIATSVLPPIFRLREATRK